MHRQVYVKVNAPVDEGVAGLVTALSIFPNLETIESCQGEPDGHNAFVYFKCGNWKDCAAVIFDEIMPALDDDLRAAVSLSVEAIDQYSALAKLAVEPAKIAALVDRIQEASSEDCSAVCALEVGIRRGPAQSGDHKWAGDIVNSEVWRAHEWIVVLGNVCLPRGTTLRTVQIKGPSVASRHARNMEIATEQRQNEIGCLI